MINETDESLSYKIKWSDREDALRRIAEDEDYCQELGERLLKQVFLNK